MNRPLARPLALSLSLSLAFRAALPLAVALPLAALSAPALATPGVEFLSERVTVVRGHIAKPVPTAAEKAKVDAELMGVIRPLMSFPKMSVAVLGKRWPTLTPEQQARFLGLFEDLVFHSYTRRIRSADNDYTVEYGEERALEGVEGGLEVDAVAKTPSSEVELRFALSPVAGGFEVVDVVIDEVSLVENYREEFARVIVKDGIDGLFSRMESQLIKEGGAPRPAPGAPEAPSAAEGKAEAGAQGKGAKGKAGAQGKGR